MSQLLERAERILESARGDEQVEVYVASGIDTEVQSYEGEVEELTTASSSGFGIRILNDSGAGARVGTAWAGSLDDEAIVNALREARDNATFATEDEFVAFARPDGVDAVSLTLTDDAVANTPLDEKIAMAIELERLVRLVYERGRTIAAERGIIIADTKFEFGRDREGRITLIDEVLTPDSSRFWPADQYEPGHGQPSFDKQPLRDYLDRERRAGRWNGDAPPPTLPQSVVDATSARYLDAFRRITGDDLDLTELT